MRKAPLLIALAVVAVVYGCGCATAIIRGEEVYVIAAGKSKATITETPGMQVCVTHDQNVTPAGRYRPILADPTLGMPPRVRCQTVDPGRVIVVEGGAISNVLAWLAAMIFSNGMIGAIP